MTTTTSNLKLTVYNAVTDGSTLFLAYVNQVSGSPLTSNMSIIDRFAGETTGSFSGLTSSYSGISASIVNVSNEASASTTRVGNESSGSITALRLETSGSFAITTGSLSGVNWIANYHAGISTEVTSGSSAVALVSASALAHSDYGKRTCVVPLNSSGSLTGVEANYIRIPSTMNSWVLTSVEASCTGSSASGSPAFIIAKANPTSASFVSMLTTNLTIDEGEYDSSTAKVAAVIDSNQRTVITGNRIKVYNASGSSSGSSVTYAQVSLTFQQLNGV